MTLSENGFENHKSVYKKCVQVRLAIIEMTNEEKMVTIGKICKRTETSRKAVYHYIQYLEKKGELVTKRKGVGTKGEILHMYLTEYATDETYDRILTSIPENARERFLSILEKKIKGK